MNEELKIKGKVTGVLPLETGSGSKGQWKRQSFVIVTLGQYPKMVCFSAFGDKADAAGKLEIGETVTVYFNIESRPYNEKYFTDVKAWKWDVEKNEEKKESKVTSIDDLADENDDLPF